MSTTDQILLSISKLIPIYVGGPLFILGTIGNLMNILVFFYMKTYRTLPTSTFLGASSIAGQIYITFNMLFAFLITILNYNPFAASTGVCMLYLCSISAFPPIAIFSLCLSVIDRYLMTTRSVRLRALITVRSAYLLVVSNVVIWVCYSIPSAFYFIRIPSQNLCTPSLDLLRTSAYFNLIFTIILPIIIMCVFGLLTWKNLGCMRHSSLNLQVAKMILVEIIVVSISYIPMGCLQLYVISVDSSQFSTAGFTFASKIIVLLCAMQSWSSFYIYFSISSTFRKTIQVFLRKTLCFWNPSITNHVTPTHVAGATTI